MKPETLQQYFDIAWKHAVVDKNPPAMEAPEIGSGYACNYRTDSGCRCLIGAAIRDEDYTPNMEGRRASLALVLIKYVFPDSKDIDELQRCHDSIQSFESLDEYFVKVEKNLRLFAQTYSVEIPHAPVDGAA